jgi:MarR family transcriptional regulator for hemolysin
MNQKRAIGRKLAVISRQLWLRFDQRVQSSGLTRAKWSLIAAVAVNPGATQRLIAGRLEVTEVTAGRLIDRLCADGLLERRENPNDRRGYCVFLTPAAQPLLQTMGEVARVHEDEAFAGIDDQDLELLDKLLDTISRNVAAASQSRHEARKSLETQAETSAAADEEPAKACAAKTR